VQELAGISVACNIILLERQRSSVASYFLSKKILKEGIHPLLHIKENPIAQIFQAQAETQNLDKILSPSFLSWLHVV
jgi:hypothetical protein